jgi:predicted membrane-bound spermidine synthase
MHAEPDCYTIWVKTRISPTIAYKLTAFGTGFVLMAYELAGARLLTPVVGSSTYVWTSIIGVIVAALSLGYVLGGKLADERNNPNDIVFLLWLCAASVISTLLLIGPVSDLLIRLRLDIRLEAVLASVVLFAPASILIGSISPYLAKLHTTSLKTAGSSIASLSALNSLGSISGTFLTGFVLFGLIGTKSILGMVVVALGCLSVAVSLTAIHAQANKIPLLIMLSGVLLVASPQPAQLVAAFDTPHASYQIRDIRTNNGDLRVLTMGPGGYQSGIYLDNPDELAFAYAQKTVDAITQLDRPSRILVLGGGSFTMPEYLAKTYPNTSVDVVELDSALTSAAKQHFFFEQPPNLSIINQDARVFVSQESSDPYDVIIVDVFSDSGVPFSVTSIEYVQGLAAKLTDHGIIVMNIIAGANQNCNPLLQSIARSFSSQLPHVGLKPIQSETLEPRQNILLLASRVDYPVIASAQPADASAGIELTDSFVPIEALHHRCSSR